MDSEISENTNTSGDDKDSDSRASIWEHISPISECTVLRYCLYVADTFIYQTGQKVLQTCCDQDRYNTWHLMHLNPPDIKNEDL